MRECSPEIGGRFPDGIVEIRRAFPDGAVKLCGDEARLPLHEQRVFLPGLEEGLLVRFIEHEDVHQHDRGGIDCKLTFDREDRVQWAHQRHDKASLT
jgi:hypothetical protein